MASVSGNRPRDFLSLPKAEQKQLVATIKDTPSAEIDATLRSANVTPASFHYATDDAYNVHSDAWKQFNSELAAPPPSGPVVGDDGNVDWDKSFRGIVGSSLNGIGEVEQQITQAKELLARQPSSEAEALGILNQAGALLAKAHAAAPDNAQVSAAAMEHAIKAGRDDVALSNASRAIQLGYPSSEPNFAVQGEFWMMLVLAAGRQNHQPLAQLAADHLEALRPNYEVLPDYTLSINSVVAMVAMQSGNWAKASEVMPNVELGRAMLGPESDPMAADLSAKCVQLFERRPPDAV
ncbi:MAG: hypothetical protein IPJ65_19840 [Archangiaceae bacterium]|nr:hypothetical protein [Archangiaceae bacterium]